MKVFFFYSISFTTCLILILLSINSQVLSLLTMRLVIVLEFTFLSLFYFYNIKNKNKKPILIFSDIAFVLYSFYDFYSSKPGEFSFIPLVIECLFFLFIIPYFFYEKMQYSIDKPIYQSPSFWVSVAFLIYFAGNFFQFLFSKDTTLYNNPNFIALYNNIYDTLTILKNVLLCTAIFVNNAQEKKVAPRNKIPISIDLDFFKPVKNNY